jgi:hypothetical protein
VALDARGLCLRLATAAGPLWLLVALASGAAAQRPYAPPAPGWTSGWWPQEPQEPSQAEPRQAQPPRRGVYREGFQGLESVYPAYPSYPTYPPGLGPKPLKVPELDPSQLLPGLIPGLSPRRQPGEPGAGPTWPSWIAGELTGEAAVATPTRAALARLADRVWFFTPDDNAFVPLSFYDKIRAVESGTLVEVRTKGDFQLVFHDGGQLRSFGRARVALGQLSEAMAELGLGAFRHMWLVAKTRPLKVVLPDRSVLELQGCSVALRSDNGIGSIRNHGPNAAVWTGRPGRVELAPAHQLSILTEVPRSEYVPAGLDLSGAVRAGREGRVLEVHAAGSGAVQWSGASFRLGSGDDLRLDPLAGAEFPERPAPSLTAASQDRS